MGQRSGPDCQFLGYLAYAVEERDSRAGNAKLEPGQLCSRLPHNCHHRPGCADGSLGGTKRVIISFIIYIK